MTEKNAIATLFYPFEQDLLARPSQGHRALFLNAQMHPFLQSFDAKSITTLQHFKPYAAALTGAGYSVSDTFDGLYDFVFAALPKNRIEAEYMAAIGLRALADGGVFVCAADNKAGGTRIQKMLQQFGVHDVQHTSKNKARVAWGISQNLNQGAISSAIDAGIVQQVLDGQYWSQPGVFGWNKIDKGSALLLQHIPGDLKGKVADFGCGYGYLLDNVLQNNDAIKASFAIDADARSIAMARKNLACFDNVEYLWADLTKPMGIPDRLDTIIMNPPFHEGKKSDSDIGVSFIRQAAASLRRNGVLYMVANNQLPYESVLEDVFFSHALIAQSGGFKIFRAVM